MKKMAYALAMFMLALLAPSSALADTLTLTLNNPFQYAAPGSTLTFDGTVQALATNSGPIYLNSDNYTINSPLILDDSDFLLNFPLSLTAGSSYTGALFTVTLPVNLGTDLFNGSFQILGGAVGYTLDELATSDFQIATTPEPSTVLLFATGFGFIALATLRKRNLSSTDAADSITA